MQDLKLPVNGDFMTTKTSFDVLNPATGMLFAKCPLTSIEQIDMVIDAAKTAQPRWWSLGQEQRRLKLIQCADLLDKHLEEIAEILTQEQGKCLKDAKREAAGVPYYFRFVAEAELKDDIIENSTHKQIRVTYKPYGVVAAIAAWNFPLALAAWKIAPALLVGNTVVLKPSPDTPLSSIRVIDLISKVLPAGVVGIITGHEKEGHHLVTHSSIDKVSFTGSVGVGKLINTAVSASLKRITLELGGNDAGIVLKDCDPRAIAKAIFNAGFVNNGQTCIALKRVYVHEDIHDALVAELTKIAAATTMGNGMEPSSTLGPLCNERQRSHIEALVNDARDRGATIHCGGERGKGDGFFYKPTIISGVKEGVRIVDEEQFGPVLPIISFKDEADAIMRANASPYGLGGSIWTNDLIRGEELMAMLDCGTAWLNQHAALDFRVPFGGAKDSGLGVEHGHDGLRSFAQKQVLNIRC